MTTEIKVVDNIYIRCRQGKGSNQKYDLWFLHGLGESGLSFKESFEIESLREFNLFVPDCPGFGASPYDKNRADLLKIVDPITEAINSLSGAKPIVIIGHSMGNVLGLEIARALDNRLAGFVNIEGNLLKQGCSISQKASAHDTAAAYYRLVSRSLSIHNKQSDDLLRYYASFRFCHEDAFWKWAKTGYSLTGEDLSAKKYRDLACPKIYYYGDKSLHPDSRQFLKDNDLATEIFLKSDHWPMITETAKFYSSLTQFLSTL